MEGRVDQAVALTPQSDRILAGAQLEPFEQSIGAMLRQRAEALAQRPILRDKTSTGSYQSLSWEEFFKEICFVGSNLLTAGVRPGDRLAMLSENRREMLISELATMSIGAISVPIFAGYFPPQIEYILNHSQATRLTVSTRFQLMKLAECRKLSRLEAVTLMDYDPSVFSVDSVCGVPVRPFETLTRRPTELGLQAFSDALEAVGAEDSCFIMYTSGTTGHPKGVELRHSNVLSQQRAVRQLWQVGPEDRFLSYLPWHHSFGGLFERFMALYSGACLSLDETGGRDIHQLLSNWRQTRPTLFFSVPSVYRQLTDEIRASAAVREEIFHPDLRFVFTAAAPLPEDVSNVFTDAGIPVLEGWGLTETSPCVTLTDPERARTPGVVGWPIPGVKVKLAGDGEILVSGPNVMRGYYRAPAANKECFAGDGWFRTGDLGYLTEAGLRILGRRDGVFKLLNAEKVFAAQIEVALINGSEYVEQAVVAGSGQDYVTALIYPCRRRLEEWCREQKIAFPADLEYGTVSEIRRLFAKEVQRVNDQIAGRYQRIRKFLIISRALSLEAGELTPTSKVVRHRVMENNSDWVEALYKPSCPPPTKAIVCLGDCY
ncbi:MAG: AMP-dependent synthetase/ligase [Acidobacteriota bacterium]